MLALHLLQSALVHVDTLLMQQVLADPKWAATLTDADRRALSLLFWAHVNPYGRFELDMTRHLDLDLTAQAALPAPRRPRGQTSGGPGVGSWGSDRLRTASGHQHPRRITTRTGVHFTRSRPDRNFMVPRLTVSMADTSGDQAGAGQPDVFACRRRLLELFAGFL
ncbi:Tn3 transposase DDE domain protein [Streptomyces malaysiensis subsp. malaysiensis]|nr:Tn3 transposase DDE domain protein [Streptomyces sp. M56]